MERSFFQQLDGALLNGTEHGALEMFLKVLFGGRSCKKYTIFNFHGFLKNVTCMKRDAAAKVVCVTHVFVEKTAQYFEYSVPPLRCLQDLFSSQNSYISLWGENIT